MLRRSIHCVRAWGGASTCHRGKFLTKRVGLVLCSAGVGVAASKVPPTSSPKKDDAPRSDEGGWIEQRVEKCLRACLIGLGVTTATALVSGPLWLYLKRPLVGVSGSLVLIPAALWFWRESFAGEGFLSAAEDEDEITPATFREFDRVLALQCFAANGIGLGLAWLGLGPGLAKAVLRGGLLAGLLCSSACYLSLTQVKGDWMEKEEWSGLVLGVLSMAALLLLTRERLRLNKHSFRVGKKSYQQLELSLEGMERKFYLPASKERLFNTTTNVILITSGFLALATGMRHLDKELRAEPADDVRSDANLIPGLESQGLQYVWTPAVIIFVAAVELFIGMI